MHAGLKVTEMEIFENVSNISVIASNTTENGKFSDIILRNLTFIFVYYFALGVIGLCFATLVATYTFTK